MRFFGISMMLIGGLTLAACEKKPTQPAATTTTSSTPQWITFDDDEEEDMDDLMVVELMEATGECGNIKKMEPMAMMGRLSDGEVNCLDDKLRNDKRQTGRDKISRLLMHDAWAKKDKHRWEALVRRHLNDIDRSDPDLVYKFAQHLAKGNPDKAAECMKWIDVALERRQHWSGELHTRRVNNLRKLKAYSGVKKWQWLEEEYARKPTEERRDKASKARNEAKTFAREWLEYAKEADKDMTQALQLCISAAGSETFCTGVLED